MYEELIERTRELAPFDRSADAERAVSVVLHALRQRLMADEAAWLSREMSGPFRRILETGAYDTDFDVEEFYRRVTRGEAERPGIGVEHAQVVCRVLAESLPRNSIERLRKHLPEYADLFSVPQAEPLPDGPDVLQRQDEASQHTLANGRPGGNHPLSEARPGSRHPLSEGRPDRAQTDSVARSRDPHAATKLSSTRGLTQEREHESLASGKPGGKD